MTYAQKMKDPRWQKRRLEILERDNWTCQCCGTTEKTLHVHHHYYLPKQEPWEADDFALTTICEVCHKDYAGFDFLSVGQKFQRIAGDAGFSENQITSIISSIDNLRISLARQTGDFCVLLDWLSETDASKTFRIVKLYEMMELEKGASK